jgi:hypothetical protein
MENKRIRYMTIHQVLTYRIVVLYPLASSSSAALPNNKKRRQATALGFIPSQCPPASASTPRNPSPSGSDPAAPIKKTSGYLQFPRSDQSRTANNRTFHPSYPISTPNANSIRAQSYQFYSALATFRRDTQWCISLGMPCGSGCPVLPFSAKIPNR